MLDEAVEDLGDEKGGEEVDQQETAHGNSTEEGVDQNEESGSVNEIEAVADLAAKVERRQQPARGDSPIPAMQEQQ